jgi:ribosomal protein S18 acetylase RimI-like enzyme
LGQLGVDIEFQGKGLGTILIKHAVSLANKIGNYSGCRIIYLEARDDAVEYYKKLCFYLVEPKPNKNRMVFDLIQM